MLRLLTRFIEQIMEDLLTTDAGPKNVPSEQMTQEATPTMSWVTATLIRQMMKIFCFSCLCWTCRENRKDVWNETDRYLRYSIGNDRCYRGFMSKGRSWVINKWRLDVIREHCQEISYPCEFESFHLLKVSTLATQTHTQTQIYTYTPHNMI